MGETALIVEVPEADHFVEVWRAHHDPVAALGVPGHITVLFPFVSPAAFDDGVLAAVRAAVEGVPAFDFALTSVEEFSGTIWLRPEPDERFCRLTARLVEAFPGYLPYGGLHPDSQPLLTVGLVGEADQAGLAGRVRAGLESHLPIRCQARAVSVFMTNRQGIWSRAHRLDLGA